MSRWTMGPCLLLLGMAFTAHAGGADTSPARHEYWIASAGGARGAYQAGVLYALLRARQQEARAGDARAPGPDGISGTSAGAINALLVALQACLPARTSRDPADNLLWGTWQALSWDALFPGDQTCVEYAQSHPHLGLQCPDPKAVVFGRQDGVLTRLALDPVTAKIRRVFARNGTPHFDEALDQTVTACSVALALSFSAEDQASLPVGKTAASAQIPIPTSRRYTTVRVQCMATSSNGTEVPCELAPKVQAPRRIQICDLPLREGDTSDAPAVSRVQLPFAREADARETQLLQGAAGVATLGDRPAPACRPVALSSFLDIVSASAAIPLAYAPQSVKYCGQGCPAAEGANLYCPVGTSLCEGRFFDGGLFDAQPLAASLALAADDCSQPGCARNARHILVAPRRTAPSEQLPVGLRGSAYYLRYFRDFVDIASAYEGQILRRYKGGDVRDGGDFPVLATIERRTRLTSDLNLFDAHDTLGFSVAGYAGFFDKDFRLFDFYVGIGSATRWLLDREQLETEALGHQVLEAAQRRPQDDFDKRHPAADAVRARAFAKEVDLRMGLGAYPGLATVASRVMSQGKPTEEVAALGRHLRCQALAQHARNQARDGQGDESLEQRELHAMDRIWEALGSIDQAAAEGKTDEYEVFAEHLKTPGPVFARAPNEDLESCESSDTDALKSRAVSSWSFDPHGSREHVSDVGHWRYEQLRQVLGRQEAVERLDGSPGTASALAMAGYAAAIASSTERRGFSVGSSTVPDKIQNYAPLANAARFLVPYTLRRDLLLGDLEASWPWLSVSTRLSYHYRLSGWVRASAGLAAHRFAADPADQRWVAGPELTAAYDRPTSPLLLPELGFRAAWWFGPHQVPDGGLPLSFGVYVRPVWPVELGFGSVGGYGIGGAPQWYFTIGLSDVSGLAYWTYRALTETVEPHSSATTSASYHEQ